MFCERGGRDTQRTKHNTRLTHIQFSTAFYLSLSRCVCSVYNFGFRVYFIYAICVCV